MEIKKGQVVWVTSRTGITETTVSSVGHKYITLAKDTRIKYNRETLYQINASGYGGHVIVDLEAYNKTMYYSKVRRNLHRLDWDVVSAKDLDKIVGILGKSIAEE